MRAGDCSGGGPGAAVCTRGPRCAQEYQSRLSGPFLDRIYFYYDTPPVTAVDFALTARGYSRVLKVARTIADLEGANAVRRVHIAEALSYRQRPPGQGEGRGRSHGTLGPRRSGVRGANRCQGLSKS